MEVMYVHDIVSTAFNCPFFEKVLFGDVADKAHVFGRSKLQRILDIKGNLLPCTLYMTHDYMYVRVTTWGCEIKSKYDSFRICLRLYIVLTCKH